jgi:hypothetical protein
MTIKELKDITFLRLDKSIRILQTEKGNCAVMLEEFKYKDKSNTFLQSGV